jgi:hypothetical protein
VSKTRKKNPETWEGVSGEKAYLVGGWKGSLITASIESKEDLERKTSIRVPY